jgi:hypothetical protein
MSSGRAMRWPLSASAAKTWAIMAATNDEIADNLFYACVHQENADIAEAFVRWYPRKPKQFVFMGVHVRPGDPLAYGQPWPATERHSAILYQSPNVLDRLWEIYEADPDADIRGTAFEIWQKSATSADLPRLQNILRTTPSFETSLEVRIKLGDDTASPLLAESLRHDPGEWCGYAPQLYEHSEVKEAYHACFAEAISKDEWTIAHSIAHLPQQGVLDVLTAYRFTLLKAPRTWQPLLASGIPGALSLVSEALEAATSDDLKYVFDFWPGTSPLTRSMLDALIPGLPKFEQHLLNRLIEHAIESGHGRWVESHLHNVVYHSEQTRWWLTEENMIKLFDELSTIVAKASGDIYRAQGYFLFFESRNRAKTLVDRRTVMRKWLGTQPTDAQIVVGALFLEHWGTVDDLMWWDAITPGEDSITVWQDARRLLEIARWANEG